MDFKFGDLVIYSPKNLDDSAHPVWKGRVGKKAVVVKTAGEGDEGCVFIWIKGEHDLIFVRPDSLKKL